MHDIKMMIEVLRGARNLIDLDIERYVCAAIYVASDGDHVTQNPNLALTGMYLRRWVMAMLSPYETLGMWLERRGTPVHTMRDENLGMARERLRVTRLAWIDWMIQELEEELQ